jgi:hypothetical protein
VIEVVLLLLGGAIGFAASVAQRILDYRLDERTRDRQRADDQSREARQRLDDRNRETRHAVEENIRAIDTWVLARHQGNPPDPAIRTTLAFTTRRLSARLDGDLKRLVLQFGLNAASLLRIEDNKPPATPQEEHQLAASMEPTARAISDEMERLGWPW